LQSESQHTPSLHLPDAQSDAPMQAKPGGDPAGAVSAGMEESTGASVASDPSDGASTVGARSTTGLGASGICKVSGLAASGVKVASGPVSAVVEPIASPRVSGPIAAATSGPGWFWALSARLGSRQRHRSHRRWSRPPEPARSGSPLCTRSRSCNDPGACTRSSLAPDRPVPRSLERQAPEPSDARPVCWSSVEFSEGVRGSCVGNRGAGRLRLGLGAAASGSPSSGAITVVMPGHVNRPICRLSGAQKFDPLARELAASHRRFLQRGRHIWPPHRAHKALKWGWLPQRGEFRGRAVTAHRGAWANLHLRIIWKRSFLSRKTRKEQL
jgi:hypothetical protein